MICPTHNQMTILIYDPHPNVCRGNLPNDLIRKPIATQNDKPANLHLRIACDTITKIYQTIGINTESGRRLKPFDREHGKLDSIRADRILIITNRLLPSFGESKIGRLGKGHLCLRFFAVEFYSDFIISFERKNRADANLA